ncbi:MAG TPA: homocysteine S-methyltransferase family protein [Rectinemataceae bacterium]|nr:homocysteine S-methyltransferase family protein [Rectinemataceae bacterium]
MARQRIRDALAGGRILVSDGAWGSYLYAKGLATGSCPELWCVDHPGLVADIAASYVAAGADMIETNSFGGSSIRLAAQGLSSRVSELNGAAARISRAAAGEGVWVIASVGPTGAMLVTEDCSEAELYDSFAEQALALAGGGADAFCVETMSDAAEAAIAIRAAKEATGLEVLATFTFSRTVQGQYRTMMGLSPEEAAAAAVAAGADVVGTNCGNGYAAMVDIAAAMRAAAPGVPIMVQANAGLPLIVDGALSYPEGPDYVASLVPALLDAGVGIIGGCCGTTPAHIAAIRRAVDLYSAPRGPWRP